MIVATACTLLLTGCDWPSFMSGPAHTGTSSDTSISAADATHGLTEKWQAGLGDPVTPEVSGSAVVAGGLVYVATQGGTLEAFKTDGGTSCSTTGTPKFCDPVWKSAALFTGYAGFCSRSTRPASRTAPPSSPTSAARCG
jgi:putative hemolysin